ncbi:Hypothetical predicted protein [Mytilus galloprovincialis]|uniref:Uncharacterized protein n=1 Tax=Mytilus galloprovincialis TaxID=29158 RepID=A0A8B6DD69_MYTGA|nr:Hypothetical predicted protein [Mytilus galloprovincialis]
MGAHGVGKTALENRLMSSEYMSVNELVIEAHQLAKEFECKYIETSAELNHKVDELLAELLKQIKLKLNPEAIHKAAILTEVTGKKHSLLKGAKRLFSKIWRRTSKPLAQCENLFKL